MEAADDPPRFNNHYATYCERRGDLNYPTKPRLHYRLDTRAVLKDPGLGLGSYHVKAPGCIKVHRIFYVHFNH